MTLQGGREVANYLQKSDGAKAEAFVHALHGDLKVTQGGCEKARLPFPDLHLPWISLLGTFMY